ncbi:MAG: hypothetical protein K9H48_11175 [Melioribacteraceae bacterium]|nr:hypothetical protein [Melioribacteraceae bacterium]
MPNHVHGIIIIDHNKKIDLSNNVGDENFRPLQHKTNLSNIIKGFKIGVTKWCRDNHYDNFKWQRSFYDRIIRTEIELFNIRKFVRENPLRWDIDNNIDNLDL